jgi:hypothetical protein
MTKNRIVRLEDKRGNCLGYDVIKCVTHQAQASRIHFEDTETEVFIPTKGYKKGEEQLDRQKCAKKYYGDRKYANEEDMPRALTEMGTCPFCGERHNSKFVRYSIGKKTIDVLVCKNKSCGEIFRPFNFATFLVDKK